MNKDLEEQYIMAARSQCDDELEIDDFNVKTSPAEDGSGCWVAAWVWVDKEDL